MSGDFHISRVNRCLRFNAKLWYVPVGRGCAVVLIPSSWIWFGSSRHHIKSWSRLGGGVHDICVSSLPFQSLYFLYFILWPATTNFHVHWEEEAWWMSLYLQQPHQIFEEMNRTRSTHFKLSHLSQMKLYFCWFFEFPVCCFT